MLSGVVCIVFSTLFFTIASSFAKFTTSLPASELVFFRSLVICLFSLGVLVFKKVSIFGKNRKMLFFRGLTGGFAVMLFYVTVRTLPLAVAVTLQFLSPVFTAFVSSFLLKEPPSKTQILALGLSMIAVFLVQKVGVDEFSIFAILGVLAAFLSSLAYTSIRTLKQSEHPLVIVLYFASISLVISLPQTMQGWVTPSLGEFVILLMMGAAAQGAQFFMTMAYQREKAPLVANLSYLNVVWAMILGEFLWNEHLTWISYCGMSLILFSAIISQIKAPEDLVQRVFVVLRGKLVRFPLPR